MVLLWGGITAVQAYRAAASCTPASAAVQLHFAVLMAVTAAALWLVWRRRAPPPAGSGQEPPGHAAPVVILCVGLTLALRLVELCAGP